MIRTYLPKNTEELIHWYERYISPLALIAGFLIDNFFLLDRVDVVFGNILLFSYLVLAAACIVLLNYVESGKTRNSYVLSVAPFVPVAMQLAFGALFSGYLALYSKSASIAVSWIFVFAIAALLIGNERFRRSYTQLPFQVAILYTALFSFLIFILPVIFKSIGPAMFLLSGAVGLFVMTLFLLVLHSLMPERFDPARTKIARIIAVLFVTFNVLYFLNLIPPLPLALKDAGVYHSITRSGFEYTLSYEPLPWYKRYFNYNTQFHRAPSESAYVFTSIFAPTGLETRVVHEWQYFDEPTGEWLTRTVVDFIISGGRDQGFRGYSQKGTLEEGKWRVNVKTQYGQLIGRVSFSVIDAPEIVSLETEVR
ncbi:MAG TPA: DUF2914 domain-containing protein [Candidatus Paceibacterota bacterium]